MNGDERKEFDFYFKWRRGDVGIIANPNEDRDPEVVVYNRDDTGKEYSYTVAWFVYDEHEQEYDLNSIGKRLTEALKEFHIPYNTFIEAIDSGMNLLNEFAKMNRLLND